MIEPTEKAIPRLANQIAAVLELDATRAKLDRVAAVAADLRAGHPQETKLPAGALRGLAERATRYAERLEEDR